MSWKTSVCSISGQHDSGALKESQPTSSHRLCFSSKDRGSMAQRSHSPSLGEKDSPFGQLRLSIASPIPSRTPSPSDFRRSSSSWLGLW